jgi:energy-coupling factor transporter ATP-binding protein EcfA2/co-chaperonin GroES (HSP10)
MAVPKSRAPALETVEPIGKRVLLRKDEDKKITKVGIHLPDKIEIPTLTGRVVAVSAEIASDSNYPIKQYDKVLFNPKHGIPVDFEGDNRLFVIPIEDVVAVFRLRRRGRMTLPHVGDAGPPGDSLRSLPDPYPVARAAAPLHATVSPPGSKSITNRLLLLAALAEGRSTLRRALRSDDTDRLVAALSTLGVGIERSGDSLVVDGVAGRFPRGGAVDLGDGGTPTRFMIAAACRAAEPVTIDGSPRMRERPVAEGVELLRSLGATIEYVEQEGRLPVRVLPSSGDMRGGTLRVGATASSQFVSAAMLLGPLLPQGLEIEYTGVPTSASYLSLTRASQGNRILGPLADERGAVRRFGRRRSLSAHWVRGSSSRLRHIGNALARHAAAEVGECDCPGRLEVERFVLALGSLAFAGASFKPLAALIGELQAAEAPAERLAEIIDEPAEDRGRGKPRIARPSRSLRFEAVRVRYPGAPEDAVREVTLEIPHGQWVALVGPNGCGKTTLAGLVSRLMLPDAGRVLVDGVDVAAVSLASLRSHVAVVSQEVVLFRSSVAENIAFGLPGVSRERIVAAARQAHADEFIKALPGGYDERVAELGASLSGGQRQRLAIARALLRDPAILILDEATSQIDPESERQINDALETLRAGRTLLTIAHRVSSMRAADRIVVMDAGRVVGDGTHEELLARCESYRRLIGAM